MRDFFPSASIIGADIDTEILSTEDRIRTFYVDQTNEKSICELWKNLESVQFDLMIDDGLHTFEGGLTLLINLLHKLKDDGVYVIEDVALANLRKFRESLSELDLSVQYLIMNRASSIGSDNNLIVIRKNREKTV